MHWSVREGLEDLLAARTPDSDSAVAAHISDCPECSTGFTAMQGHARMLKLLQAPADLEPSAGFYARVLQRIEERAKHSIWWVFVHKPVGRRLALASFAVAVALGAYVVAAEASDGHIHSSLLPSAGPAFVVAEDVSGASHYDAPVTGNADEQRQAVLANFVSHRSVAE